MFIIGDRRRQLDRMTRQLYDPKLVKDAQLLGFLYEGTNSKPTCGVALVEIRIVITDGSCVPEETDLSKIHILFRVVEDYTSTDIYNVLRRENYRTNNVHIVILIVRTFMQTQGFILKSVE